jgi:hypothetical protein
MKAKNILQTKNLVVLKKKDPFFKINFTSPLVFAKHRSEFSQTGTVFFFLSNSEQYCIQNIIIVWDLMLFCLSQGPTTFSVEKLSRRNNMVNNLVELLKLANIFYLISFCTSIRLYLTIRLNLLRQTWRRIL